MGWSPSQKLPGQLAGTPPTVGGHLGGTWLPTCAAPYLSRQEEDKVALHVSFISKRSILPSSKTQGQRAPGSLAELERHVLGWDRGLDLRSELFMSTLFGVDHRSRSSRELTLRAPVVYEAGLIGRSTVDHPIVR